MEAFELSKHNVPLDRRNLSLFPRTFGETTQCFDCPPGAEPPQLLEQHSEELIKPLLEGRCCRRMRGTMTDVGAQRWVKTVVYLDWWNTQAKLLFQFYRFNLKVLFPTRLCHKTHDTHTHTHTHISYHGITLRCGLHCSKSMLYSSSDVHSNYNRG